MSALEVPATIAGNVPVSLFSAALAHAGLVGRYDHTRGLLVIEPASSDRAAGAPGF